MGTAWSLTENRKSQKSSRGVRDKSLTPPVQQPKFLALAGWFILLSLRRIYSYTDKYFKSMVVPESYQDGNESQKKYLRYQAILEFIKN